MKQRKRPKTIVGKRLMILKREYAMTYREMADDLGADFNGVAHWMTRYVFPSAQMIIKICKTYDVSADWLLGLSDERKRHD